MLDYEIYEEEFEFFTNNIIDWDAVEDNRLSYLDPAFVEDF